MTKTFKVKAFMDDMCYEVGYNIVSKLLNEIPYGYEDDIWSFELEIRNIKQEEYDEDFSGVEISEIKNETKKT